MSEKTEIWLQNLADERDGAALYSGLAELEQVPARSLKFRELADGEKRHAEIWAKKLLAAQVELPADRPSPRVRLLLWLAKRLGTTAVLPLVMETEAGDADKYARQGGDATPLASEERAHREVLVGLGGTEAQAGTAPGSLIVHRERWHKGGRAGAIRAAVFGMNDGLVSNLSLVLGVAAAGLEQQTVLLTGVAGLLAGACSMAAGEYISVASQRDLLQRQIDLERRELAEAPAEEAAELALIYRQKGVSAEQAGRMSSELLRNPESALDTLVREELGLDPGDLGSPLAAAASSFATFAVGAALPILPFLAFSGWVSVAVSAGLCGAVLAAVGSLLGFLSGTSPWRSGARMLGLAAVAAGITFGLGRLFGTTLS